MSDEDQTSNLLQNEQHVRNNHHQKLKNKDTTVNAPLAGALNFQRVENLGTKLSEQIHNYLCISGLYSS